MRSVWIALFATLLPALASGAKHKIPSDWRTFTSTLCYSFRYPKNWRVSVNDEVNKPEYASYVELNSPIMGPPWGNGPGKEQMECEFARDFFSLQGDLRSAALHQAIGGKLLRVGPMMLGGRPAYESVFNTNGEITRAIFARDKKGSAYENIEIDCDEGGGDHEWGGKSWQYTSDRQWKFAHTLDEILSSFRFLDCPAPKRKSGRPEVHS